jgi:hypothetical protein
VKCILLDLRPLDQFLDPIEQTLIGDSGLQSLVMRDLAVEFDAPATHAFRPFFRQGETTSSSHFTTTERQFSFNAPRSFGSGFYEAVSGQRRPSDRHRQAVADLVHLRRNVPPEIAITAVLHATG